MSFKSFISGCAGLELSEEETAFFRAEKPIGLILFQRNCHDKQQVKALTNAYRNAVGEQDVLILIDQEGGRVARLKPPQWRVFPSARQFGLLYKQDEERALEAATLVTRLLASELYELGINVDCLPVLDLPVPGADAIIGDRAYDTTAQPVIKLARAVTNGLLAGGVLPVAKHIPGHGRANADSHKALPVINTDRETLEQNDFVPFQALNDLPLAMTAHVLMPAFDPDEPASTSPTIISDIIRDQIGFDGALMCDDLSMQALEGSLGERTARVLAAGCDLALHCNGDMKEMKTVAQSCNMLEGEAARRVNSGLSKLQKPEDFDEERAEQLRMELLSASM